MVGEGPGSGLTMTLGPPFFFLPALAFGAPAEELAAPPTFCPVVGCAAGASLGLVSTAGSVTNVNAGAGCVGVHRVRLILGLLTVGACCAADCTLEGCGIGVADEEPRGETAVCEASGVRVFFSRSFAFNSCSLLISGPRYPAFAVVMEATAGGQGKVDAIDIPVLGCEVALEPPVGMDRWIADPTGRTLPALTSWRGRVRDEVDDEGWDIVPLVFCAGLTST